MILFTGSGGAGSDARGSLFEPEELGAQGGANGGHAGGLGGSFIKVTIGSVFYMDGTLNADGGAGSNHAGGGSGGSIWINVDDMRGHGDIRAVGGLGSEAAGGGSGGRIALYTTSDNEYRGAFTVQNNSNNFRPYFVPNLCLTIDPVFARF